MHIVKCEERNKLKEDLLKNQPELARFEDFQLLQVTSDIKLGNGSEQRTNAGHSQEDMKLRVQL